MSGWERGDKLYLNTRTPASSHQDRQQTCKPCLLDISNRPSHYTESNKTVCTWFLQFFSGKFHYMSTSWVILYMIGTKSLKWQHWQCYFAINNILTLFYFKEGLPTLDSIISFISPSISKFWCPLCSKFSPNLLCFDCSEGSYEIKNYCLC